MPAGGVCRRGRVLFAPLTLTRATLCAGIRKYLRIIGITKAEVHAIRQNLLASRQGLNRLRSHDMLSAFSMGSEAGDGPVSPLSP